MASFFSRRLVAWYHKNKRELPWRETRDPYRIWLSEVILQQTRVSQGLAYYNRFVSAYPTIADLARASEDEVLRHWQGLGYYSRGRNMLAAARSVEDQFNGVFPRDYKDIRELKGVGDYTAAAISSFAFGTAHAVVDGNVFRVLSRYFGVGEPIDTAAGKKLFSEIAARELDIADPATHNQAIMEFGALQCTPVNPGCDRCPLSPNCTAYAAATVNALPVKSKKTSVRTRHFNYVVRADARGRVFIRRRNKKDIWQGLYEFDLFESESELTPEKFLAQPGVLQKCGSDCAVKFISRQYSHVLTHQRLNTRFYVLQARESSPEAIVAEELHKYAFPVLITRFLEDCDLREIF